MIEAIFFDFNGVIINDERIQMSAYQDVLKAHGIDLTEEGYFSALGMDDETFVRTTFERAGKQLPERTCGEILRAKTEIHRKFMETELPFFPGVITFLKATARHYELGLVSMANREEIGYVLERDHLASLFTVMISAEDVNACKPAPDCYRRAFEQLNILRRQRRGLPLLAEECLVVEDSPPGIQSGRGAGMRTLGVSNTVSEEALRAAGAEVVTHSLADWTVDSVRHVFSQ